MNRTKDHQKLVDDVLLAVGSLPYARVWPQVNGTFRDFHNTGRVVTVGLPGSGDITGILKGRRLEIEIKTGLGKQSIAQIRFQTMIEKHGGVYIVARSVSQCLADLKKYL